METNFSWNLIGTERLILYYDSVEELGRLIYFKCIFFSLRAGVSSESNTTKFKRGVRDFLFSRIMYFFLFLLRHSFLYIFISVLI